MGKRPDQTPTSCQVPSLLGLIHGRTACSALPNSRYLLSSIPPKFFSIFSTRHAFNFNDLDRTKHSHESLQPLLRPNFSARHRPLHSPVSPRARCFKTVRRMGSPQNHRLGGGPIPIPFTEKEKESRDDYRRAARCHRQPYPQTIRQRTGHNRSRPRQGHVSVPSTVPSRVLLVSDNTT